MSLQKNYYKLMVLFPDSIFCTYTANGLLDSKTRSTSHIPPHQLSAILFHKDLLEIYQKP